MSRRKIADCDKRGSAIAPAPAWCGKRFHARIDPARSLVLNTGERLWLCLPAKALPKPGSRFGDFPVINSKTAFADISTLKKIWVGCFRKPTVYHH
jgi:hypothetical protein